MALTPLKPPTLKKFPSFQLGKKPTWNAGVKRPNMLAARSVSPRPDPPPGSDYGQNALYPGGYQGVPNPVDMSTFFTTGVPTYNTGQPNPLPVPNYGDMISGDWEVQDAEAAMASQMARARGDFQAQLRSQLIDLGLSDTSKLGNLGKYIDADTIKAAVANKYSSTAQNAQIAEKARAGNNAALAARGILNSGATTNAQQQVSAGQEGANYQGLRGFLEGGASGLSGLADLEYNMARGVAQARAAAAQRAAEYAQLGAYGDNPNRVVPNESGFYDVSSIVGTRQAGPPVTGVANPMLTQRQFLRKNPRGNYYNYMRAYYKRNPSARVGG